MRTTTCCLYLPHVVECRLALNRIDKSGKNLNIVKVISWLKYNYKRVQYYPETGGNAVITPLLSITFTPPLSKDHSDATHGARTQWTYIFLLSWYSRASEFSLVEDLVYHGFFAPLEVHMEIRKLVMSFSFSLPVERWFGTLQTVLRLDAQPLLLSFLYHTISASWSSWINKK